MTAVHGALAFSKHDFWVCLLELRHTVQLQSDAELTTNSLFLDPSKAFVHKHT